MTANSLRALDGFVSLVSGDEERTYQQIVTIATSLLSSPLPQQVQEQAKMLLASLHPTKMTYYNHKVCALYLGLRLDQSVVIQLRSQLQVRVIVNCSCGN